jgi:hypothetical protein
VATGFRVPRSALGLAALALIATLVLYPLIPLRRYYAHESSLDPDNATFLETVRLVKEFRGPEQEVLLAPQLVKIDLKDGATTIAILDTLLMLEGIPHRIIEDPATDILRAAEGLMRLSGRLRLRELYWYSPSYYGLYRYTPDLAPNLRCLPFGGPTPGD